MTVKPHNAHAARAILAKAAEMRAKGPVTSQLFQKLEHDLSAEEWAYFKAHTHPKQWELLSSRNQFKALLSCRRWGKTTYAILETIIHSRRFPKSTIFYIVPDSKAHARRLFWRPFTQLNQQLGLNLTFHETDKRITTPEGTDILLFGAKDKDAAVQLRGDQSGLSLAILDECKDFGPYFEEVVEEAVIPALRDWGGTLVLQGSPGNILDGLFYKVTVPNSELEKEGWLVVRGRVADNIFNKPEDRDERLIWLKYYKKLGMTMDSPRFRREIRGEWCTDDSERVYLYDVSRNHYDFMGGDNHGLPLGPNGEHHDWKYCLGLDLGEQDANAFVVYAFADTCSELFAIDYYARPAMSIDEIYGKYREFEAKYDTFTFAVADTYGYGRGIVTDLQTRFQLPLEAADKGKNKLGNIALMNNDFLSGRLKCHKDSPLAKEWLHLAKRIHPVTKKVMLQHSDYGDAALYGWKASLHWASKEIPLKPLPNSAEFWQSKEQEEFERALERKKDRFKAPSERNY